MRTRNDSDYNGIDATPKYAGGIAIAAILMLIGVRILTKKGE